VVDALRKVRGKKQRKLVKAVVAEPEATLEELGVRAGYQASPKQHAWQAMQNPNVQAAIRELLNANPKTRLEALTKKLEEGLEATETKFFTHHEDVGRGKKKRSVFKIEERECVDFSVRKGYLEMAFELHGALKSDDLGGGAFSLSLVLFGKAGEEQNEQAYNVILASRIQRGLHPTENRRLTVEEAEAFKR
jgi:hypothetical protein